MKFSIRTLPFGVLSAMILTAACHKDNNYTAPPPNPGGSNYKPTALQTYISSDTSLSIYNAAIARAGDSSLYHGSDSVTVLIPTNDAFRAAGISTSTINSMSKSAIDSLLRYHFVNNSISLQNGTYGPYSSALGPNIYGFGGSTDSNYFNGGQAQRVAVPNSPATVYRLSTPLGIPYSTGADYFASDTSLSFFNAALNRAGVNLDNNTSWTTVLAPTNDAFRSAGYASISDINAADSATLRNRLMYHMLPGQYFTNSYNGITSVPTSNSGSNITIGSGPNGATFTGTGNTSAAGFAGPNQIAGSNTVYQPINGILAQ